MITWDWIQECFVWFLGVLMSFFVSITYESKYNQKLDLDRLVDGTCDNFPLSCSGESVFIALCTFFDNSGFSWKIDYLSWKQIPMVVKMSLHAYYFPLNYNLSNRYRHRESNDGGFIFGHFLVKDLIARTCHVQTVVMLSLN